jgi:hypothetical protein
MWYRHAGVMRTMQRCMIVPTQNHLQAISTVQLAAAL